MVHLRAAEESSLSNAELKRNIKTVIRQFHLQLIFISSSRELIISLKLYRLYHLNQYRLRATLSAMKTLCRFANRQEAQSLQRAF